MTLAERDHELRELVRYWDDARRGRGQVVLIRGAIGSGKTLLLHAFTRNAAKSGAIVVGGVGARTERTLPFGVVRQLFRQVALAPDRANLVGRLIENGALTAALHPPQDERAAEALAPVLHGLCTALLDLSLRGPLIIAVDDVHVADVASMLCLLYVVRRANTAPVLLALTETAHTRLVQPGLHTDLLRQPHCHELKLPLLSVDGVSAMLADAVPVDFARRLAEDALVTTGGNPLLVRGLAADNRAPHPSPERLVVGEGFAESVLSCLHRSAASTLRVAHALAVLAGPAPTRLLGRLAEVSDDVAAEEVGVLADAGLLRAGWFRHPAVRAGVLNGLAATEVPAMHGRAAALLRGEGLAALVVARHLVLADRVEWSWAVPTLREAAEQALARNEVDEALRYLRLADRICIDDREHADVKAMLACVEWRLDPATAARHHPYLIAAHRAGHLVGPLAGLIIKQLLWRGAFDEAIDRITDHPAGLAAELAVSATTARTWLRYAYPVLPSLSALPSDDVPAPEDPVSAAERLLRESTLGDPTIGPLVSAVLTLAYCDHLDAAILWCGELLQAAVLSRAPLWQAVFTALQAMMSERQGDLVRAESLARTALTTVSHTGWGVTIGIPLATLVSAATAQGQYAEAVGHLKVPVPQAMFHTAHALPYLQARGRLYLSLGRLDTALTEFRRCGELMRTWNLDLSMVVPWRTDAATVHLELGERQQARRLVEEQLALLAPRFRRVRAVSLRVLAAASPLAQRPARLREAARALQICGDRLELARTLADLAEVHRTRGEHAQARARASRALQLAQQCGAVALSQRLASLAGNRAATRGPAVPAAEQLEDLSDAQRRVAELAAIGLSNREIADSLFVTVSTVEQHLTRVYRKLNVKRRSMLPLDFGIATEQRGV